MPLLQLAWASLRNRRATALLTIFTIAVSVALLLGVERLRTEAKASFARTIAGTDLVVGARSGAVNLLLYSVFRIGNATNNIRWESYEKLAADPRVAWTIPLSLGDSHRGYRVLGTDGNYFTHYHYGRNQPLRLAQGRPFNDVFEVVLGAEVAKALHYRLGDKIVLAHGVATISLTEHSDHPFTVVGILAPTGTPVDRTLHIPLSGMTALHLDWRGGMPGPSLSDAEVRQRDLTPQDLTAALVGLKSRVATFAVQRAVNSYTGEPLLAILPGVALQELWGLLGTAEQALLVMSLCVVLTGLVGMLTALLASLNERRREMAILRSVGAQPRHLFGLLLAEALALTLAGCLGGLALLYGAIALGRPWLLAEYGLALPLDWPSLYDGQLLGGILLAALVLGCIPAWRGCRQALTDGLSVRL